jgi:hypothetical protein
LTSSSTSFSRRRRSGPFNISRQYIFHIIITLSSSINQPVL